MPSREIGWEVGSPFLLAHGLGHNECTWFPLFLVCYFHHERDGDIPHSHNQSHTMDGIAIGSLPTLNALLVYNPQTKHYYEPGSYHLNPYWLPSSVYPNLKYNGGLFCSLYCDKNPPVEEPFPLGTRVERLDWTTNIILAGTVMGMIPLSTDSSGSQVYHFFDNGTSASIPLDEKPSLIPLPPVLVLAPEDSSQDPIHLSFLPSYLSTVELRMNTMVLTTKGFLLANLAGPTVLVLRHTSRRRWRIGASTFPIYLLRGWISAQRGFLLLAMLCTCFSAHLLLCSLPLLLLRLIRW
jgi:hypothetical protein